MKKIIIITIAIFITFCGCKNKEEVSKIDSNEFDTIELDLDKIVIINLNEVSLLTFKVKITNPSNSSVILLDNSLKEYFKGISKAEKTGFYLNDNKNDIIPLGINNYYYTKLDPHSSNYYFIGTKDFDNLSEEKDSLLLKKKISNYIIKYNGEKLDLNNLKKSKYIRQTVFDNFVKGKRNYLAYNDSISLNIPTKTLKLKYVNEMPTNKIDWDKL